MKLMSMDVKGRWTKGMMKHKNSAIQNDDNFLMLVEHVKANFSNVDDTEVGRIVGCLPMEHRSIIHSLGSLCPIRKQALRDVIV